MDFIIVDVITFLILVDGTMLSEQRTKALQRFKEDPNCTVFLASLKCASTGLNLTMASNVIMLDLWWNPAIEGNINN